MSARSLTDTNYMAITMGTEFALNLHITAVASYSEVEEALLDAGITNYAILRWTNPDNTCDIQITVRGTNYGDVLNAVDALPKLAEAIAAVDSSIQEQPEPSA